MVRLTLLPTLCAILFLACSISCEANKVFYDGLVVIDAKRTLDLTTHSVKSSTIFEFKNVGSKATSTFWFAVPSSVNDHVAFVEARDAKMNLLTVSKAFTNPLKEGAVFYEVQFPGGSLAANQSVKVRVKVVLTKVLTPFPKEISQQEDQLVVYDVDSHIVFCPYTVRSQSTEALLPSSTVESTSKYNNQAPKVKGDRITYGPFSTESAPFSLSPMRIHFQNNNPFLTVTNLERLVEVSHWGNIAVEEKYKIKHDGAKLKGGFSMLDYTRGRRSAPSSFRELPARIPRYATDMYYRDQIGNVSTSLINGVKNAALEVILLPRFPLFGGWKIDFTFGFNLPLPNYVSSSGSHYVLNMTFGCPLNNAVVEHQVIRVVLPEGASNAQVHVPFNIDGESRDTHFTYLDVYGRTVVVIEKSNVVAEHNQRFQVSYQFHSITMLQEPAIIIASLFALLFTIILLQRVQLSISKGTTDAKALAQDSIIEKLDEIRDLQNKRNRYYQSAEDKLMSSGASAATAEEEKKKLKNDLKDISKNVESIISQLELLDKEIAAKVSNVERLEKEKLVKFNELIAAMFEAKPDTKQIEKLEKQYTQTADQVASIIKVVTKDL